MEIWVAFGLVRIKISTEGSSSKFFQSKLPFKPTKLRHTAIRSNFISVIKKTLSGCFQNQLVRLCTEWLNSFDIFTKISTGQLFFRHLSIQIKLFYPLGSFSSTSNHYQSHSINEICRSEQGFYQHGIYSGIHFKVCLFKICGLQRWSSPCAAARKAIKSPHRISFKVSSSHFPHQSIKYLYLDNFATFTAFTTPLLV